MMSSLSPITEERPGAMHDVEAILIGKSLESVLYRPLGGAERDQIRWSQPVHEVDLDISLGAGAGAFTISWARDNLTEGLAFTIVSPAKDSSATGPWESVEHLAEWTDFMALPIAKVSFGWQISGDGCPPSVWSMNLTNSGSKSVVIALGEIAESNRPTYHPDSIVVIFDADIARDYSTPASIGSAWAE